MFYVNARAIIETTINDELHIVVQTRNKAGEQKNFRWKIAEGSR